MNFKRNLIFITSALVGALSLTSCVFDGPTKFKHFDFINDVEDKHQNIEKDGYIKYGDYLNYEVSDTHGGKVDLGTAYEVFRDHAGYNNIPSEGRQKMIVVPVTFSDYGTDKLNMTDDQFIENINKAFFGVPKNTSYVSVGQYFNLSSYGKLKLGGKVCDKVFQFPVSVEKIRNDKIKREKFVERYYNDVIEWYKENYDDIEDYKIEGLQEDKNVPIFMVYTYPSVENTEDEKTESFFWAYTFQNIPMSWASSSFMNLQYGEPDSHTYIHETGHLFGLNDYYPTLALEDKNAIIPEPTARIDMMDCSIGDETSFSKMYLNWSRPYSVTDSCEITIKSFTESGDVVLLANNWNKTVFDEYYLFEYYTPTGLNTHDISVGNNQAKLPKVPGIKIYHVDARLAYFSNRKTISGYCENGATAPTATNVGFAHDNNTYDDPSDYEKNYLYSLVLNHKNGMISSCATDSNLFRFGDEIPQLKLTRDGEINYKISITSSSFDDITLKFEKVENL